MQHISQLRTILLQKHSKYMLLLITSVLLFINMSGIAQASTITFSNASTALVTNTGEYIYFGNTTYSANVTIDDATRQMNGYAWSTDMGWLYFGSGADNSLGPVVIAANGRVTGKAKFLNGGYVDFNASPSGSNVTVQSVTGVFSGYAWSEDLGWIDFGNVAAPGFVYTPSAPTLSQPANGSSGVSTTPIFRLGTTDTESDYLRYKIEICSDAACNTIIRTIDQTSSQTGWLDQTQQSNTAYASGPSSIVEYARHQFQSPALSPGTTYYWRGYAIDPGGSNTWSGASSIFSFTISNNPSAPTLAQPQNGASGVYPLPIFRLGSTDAESDYLRYKIEVCSDSACNTVIRTIDQTSSQTGWLDQNQQGNTAYSGGSSSIVTYARHQYQELALTPSTTYYWRGFSIDPAGSNTWSGASSIWSFTAGNGQSADINIGGGTTIYGGATLTPN